MWKMDYIKVILIVILVRGGGGLHKDGMERADLPLILEGDSAC